MRPIRYALLALALALAAPLAATSAHAQIIPKFGATGGLNFGSLSDAAGADLESSTGYHIGVFGDMGLGPLAARVSLLYVKAGDVEGLTDDQSITFVAVPVDFKFRFPSPVVKPYVLLGPEARFLTGDVADTDGSRSVGLALNAGIGAELSALIGPSVFAELRYGLDVSGLFEEREIAGVGTVDDSFKVSMFYLRVGVGL